LLKYTNYTWIENNLIRC